MSTTTTVTPRHAAPTHAHPRRGKDRYSTMLWLGAEMVTIGVALQYVFSH